MTHPTHNDESLCPSAQFKECAAVPSPRPHSRWAPVGKSDIEHWGSGSIDHVRMSAGPQKGAGQPTTHQHPSEFNLLWLYRHGYRTSPFRFSSNRLLISATSARGRWLGGGAEASERRHTLGQRACVLSVNSVCHQFDHVVVPRGGYIILEIP